MPYKRSEATTCLAYARYRRGDTACLTACLAYARVCSCLATQGKRTRFANPHYVRQAVRHWQSVALYARGKQWGTMLPVSDISLAVRTKLRFGLIRNQNWTLYAPQAFQDVLFHKNTKSETNLSTYKDLVLTCIKRVKHNRCFIPQGCVKYVNPYFTLIL